MQPSFAQEIKVGLYDKIDTLYLNANKKYQIIEDLEDSAKFAKPRLMLETNKPALIRSSPAAANSLLVAAAPDLVTTSKVTKFSCEDCIFTIKSGLETRKYRGSIVIKPRANDFTVINQVELEDYLRGVVPAEMPYSWPTEALKAQAVAARTYTLSMLGRRQALGYDLKSGVEDQVYRGYQHEKQSTDAAILATQGEYMIDRQGVLVDAYFSSQAGSYSAAPETTWGLSPKSYLVPRKEYYPTSGWRRAYNHSTINLKFKDLKLGPINAITIVNRSLEGRVAEILLSGVTKSMLLTGEEFRHKLGLRSTDFDIDYQEQQIIISGHGFGHGIGLSQYGAKNLAAKGKNYQEILGHYYHGAKLVLKQ